jgi:hypothetical protein
MFQVVPGRAAETREGESRADLIYKNRRSRERER